MHQCNSPVPHPPLADRAGSRRSGVFRLALAMLVALVPLGASVALAQDYSALLDGVQECPPSGSPANGSACFWLDATSRLHYMISYSGLGSPVTAAHLHGPPGCTPPCVDCPPIFPLVPAGPSPIAGVVGPLSAAQVGDLNAGNWYVNIHTAVFGGGEIRGKIVVGGCEKDVFPGSKAKVTIMGPPGCPCTVVLTGPATALVNIAGVRDQGLVPPEPDGLEQVQTELVAMSLTGTDPILGTVTMRLPQSAHPTQASIGEIEEDANTAPNRLDLPPFAPSGTATSFFDVFFEVETSNFPGVLHNDPPNKKRMQTRIRHKPPIPGDNYESPLVIPLLNAADGPTGIQIGPARHAPDPIEHDFFPNSHAVIEIVCTGPLPCPPGGLDETIALDGPTAVDVAMWNLRDQGAVPPPEPDGLEQVQTEMVQLQLTSSYPTVFGPPGSVVVHRQTGPYPPVPHGNGGAPYAILGEIEETGNPVPGRLDMQPFAPGGNADSFFDVFFEVDLPTMGMRLHNHDSKHLRTTISYKPPAPGETYEDNVVIPLFDQNCNPTPFVLRRTRHTPNATGGVGVEPGVTPSRIAIQAVRPNPFNNSTTITYGLPKRDRVNLVIYDVSGRVLRTLVNRVVEAGSHNVTWDGRTDRGRPTTPGVYFAKMESGGLISVRRVVMLK